MPKASIAPDRSLVLVGRERGLSIIPQPTPLTRLRFFDGKFLRAADLELEQRYHRELVAQSNRAGGSGVVHGFDCTLAGDALTVGGGLAIDPEGRVLLLPEERQVSLDDLIGASRARPVAVRERPAAGRRLAAAEFADCVEAAADDAGAVAEGATLHLIVAFHAEALCGEEDVYGKLCEEACVTSTERPYLVEGVVIRAVPFDLVTALATSTAVTLTRKHLRSRVASAFFEDERRAVASLISRQGLGSEAWCRGAVAAAGAGVPLALVARAGSDVLYLDAWTARRERIEAPPRRHWARVMAMRPWDVFLAQVLQFQCQLRSALDDSARPGEDDDPCAEAHRLLADASAGIERVLRGVAEERASVGPAAERLGRAGDREEVFFREAILAETGDAAGLKTLDSLRSRLAAAAEAFFTPATERLLLAGGIVEVPSAGYLPVLPQSAVGVERQVRQLLGDGLDLRFCVVRPDFVPHALEEAQHMERISLTAGLDDPGAKPRVDVLVPDGVFEERPVVAPGTGYETRLRIEGVATNLFGALFGGQAGGTFARRAGATAIVVLPSPIAVFGAARAEELPGGGSAFHFAGGAPPSAPGRLTEATAAPVSADPATVFDRRLVDLAPDARLRAVDPIAEARPGTSVFGRNQGPGALWATLRTDRDPFALPLHGTAEVSAELTLLHPSAPPRRIRRLHFAGTLAVRQRRSLGGGGFGVDVRLSGTGTVTETQPDAPTSGIASVQVDQTVRLERAAGERGTVRILMPGGPLWSKLDTNFVLEVERRWPAADRAEVASVVRVTREDERPPVFHAEERVDAAVLSPGNAAHDASLAALETLGAALGDSDFAAAAARKLFPPPEPGGDAATLRATRDWVLFHRRRDKDCGERVAPVKRVEARRYRLFQVGLREADEVAILRELLASGGSLPGFTPRLVGTVDFGAGIQAVQTPHDEVRTDWSARVPAEVEIVYGSIASTGAALDEGEPLARSRLGALAEVLAPLAGRRADATLETLAAIPPALSPGDGDGVILVATLGVALACNEVYRAVLTDDQLGALLELAREARLAVALREFQAQRLGKAGFRSGTAEPFGPGMADVPGEWQRAGNGAVAQVVAVTAAGSAPVEASLAADQAGRIAAAAGGASGDEAPPVRTIRAVDRTLGECPAVTLLVARPALARTCHEVVVIPATTRDRLGGVVESIAANGLRPEVLRGRGMTSLGEVEFTEGSEEPIPETLRPVVATWREAVGGAIPEGFTVRGIAVSPAGSSEELQQLHRRQAGSTLEALGGSPEVLSAVNGSDVFPVQCDSLTLVVPVRTGTSGVVPVVVDPQGDDTRVVLAPRFDADGELIRDEAFEREVETLRAEGTRFVRVAFAAGERPEGSDRRLTSLFDALDEAGLVKEDARRSTRTLKRDDRRKLERRVGAAVPEVLILEVE